MKIKISPFGPRFTSQETVFENFMKLGPKRGFYFLLIMIPKVISFRAVVVLIFQFYSDCLRPFCAFCLFTKYNNLAQSYFSVTLLVKQQVHFFRKGRDLPNQKATLEFGLLIFRIQKIYIFYPQPRAQQMEVFFLSHRPDFNLKVFGNSGEIFQGC